MNIKTINPATEEVLASYEFQKESAVSRSVDSAHTAFHEWRRLDLEARLNCARQFASAMHAARVPMAELMTREMGKPLKDSLGEVDKCVVSVNFLAENFPKWHAEKVHDVGKGFSVTLNPLGVILGIMPWNFPLWQVVRWAVPTLLCGNTAILKHAPNTWGSGEMIGDLFAQAFPESVFINLKIDVPTVTTILDDFRVRGVSLTGSVAAGRSVGALAGARLKRCVLELGGSDAYIVLDDADIDVAVKTCVDSRMINAGQSCVSAKRFIVTRKNAAKFTDGMRALLEQKKFGDPMTSKAELGPLARKDLRAHLHEQVEKSVAAGSKLVLGGSIPSGKGYYYPPSLLTHVRPGSPAFDEELFGPVAAVIEADDERQAVALANRSRYGLGGAVFSKDIERAKKIAETEIEAGMVFVNDFVKSDASVPFGGVKDSGLGRELGAEGCFEFTNIKTIKV
jgi:succinate-semialdehyde dehydrogenase/glutarate-semialdehyde dehydrogenase